MKKPSYFNRIDPIYTENFRANQVTDRKNLFSYERYWNDDHTEIVEYRFRKGDTDTGELFKTYPVKGYIMKHYYCTKEQLQYINRKLKPFGANARRFWCHILASMLVLVERNDKKNRNLKIPVYSKLRDLECPPSSWSWKDLVAAGLLEVSEYRYKKGLCRTYRIPRGIFEYYRTLRPALSEFHKAKLFNMFSGKARRVEKKKHSTAYDSAGNANPEVLVNAHRLMGQNRLIFNKTALDKAMAEKREEVDRKYGHISSYKDEKPEHHSLRSAETAYQAIVSHPTFVERHAELELEPANLPDAVQMLMFGDVETISSYRPDYDFSYPGRSTEKGGGFQSLKKLFKDAAMKDLKGYLYNYDLVASQIVGAQQQFEIAGIQCGWLEIYRTTPNAKEVYAERAQMPPDAFKTALLATLMGALVPDELRPKAVSCRSTPGKKKGKKPRSQSMKKLLLSVCDNDYAAANAMLVRFKTICAELLAAVRQWHNWLLDVWVPTTAKTSKSGTYVINAAQMKLYLTGPKWLKQPRHKRISTLSAFLLQGQEAHFIATLTNLSANPGFDFKVLANEHDGLLTIGKIPNAAVEMAARHAGVKNFKMIVKSFI